MTTTITATVDDDGVLHLPLGVAAAGRQVRATVQVLPKPMTQEQWRAAILESTGSITDPSFVRPPQDPFEDCEPRS